MKWRRWLRICPPSSIGSHPNFTNLHNLRRHILTAPKLSPEQHIGVGGAYHGKTHIASSRQHRSGSLLTRDHWRSITHPQWRVEIVDMQGDLVLDVVGFPTYDNQQFRLVCKVAVLRHYDHEEIIDTVCML